jgi:hypothetical protein
MEELVSEGSASSINKVGNAAIGTVGMVLEKRLFRKGTL